MNGLRVYLLLLLAITAVGVVLKRDPVGQTLAISFYGILLGVLFFSFEAPDVALSQIVIGAVVLPLMALLTIGRMRAEEERKEKKSRNKESSA